MTEERAFLAGGCFWGMQDLVRRQPGVISTRVGYTGGKVPNATYRNHEGHAEAIEIIFDPEKTTYRTLLEFFFQIHDPTTLNRQGNDRGTSYRSAIFHTSDEQKKVAEDTIADVEASINSKMAILASACVLNRRRFRSSHSKMAKKLSHIALS
jgi:peptide-methionine (S)-S-oxide reductase